MHGYANTGSFRQRISAKVLSLGIAAGCCTAAAPLLTMAYTVQEGDTLSAICGGYEAALEVAALNGIDNPDLIYIGQEITLPGEGSGAAAETSEYTDEVEVGTVEVPASSDSADWNLISTAESYIGTGYVWGGSSPSGFDCSGFVSYAINHSGNGWNVGRPSAEGLRGYCTTVSKDEMKPGDLVFFQGTYGTSGASHVGIYIGDGQMVHCSTKYGVTVSDITTSYWTNHYLESGRLNM